MIRIPIKPFSQNRVKSGRSFKTSAAKDWEMAFWLLLKKHAPVRKMSLPSGDLELHFHFGFSSRNADVDNPVKIAQDILCKHMGFKNDNRVRAISVRSTPVKKGDEFLSFAFCRYRDDERWESLMSGPDGNGAPSRGFSEKAEGARLETAPTVPAKVRGMRG